MHITNGEIGRTLNLPKPSVPWLHARFLLATLQDMCVRLPKKLMWVGKGVHKFRFERSDVGSYSWVQKACIALKQDWHVHVCVHIYTHPHFGHT